MSKSYVAILAVVLVAALLGMAIAEDPGYLLIAWRNVSIETSIWVGIGFLLACWLRSRGCRPQKGSGRGSGQAGRKNNEGRVL